MFYFFFYFSHEGREKYSEKETRYLCFTVLKIYYLYANMYACTSFFKIFHWNKFQPDHFDIISGSLVGIISHLTF